MNPNTTHAIAQTFADHGAKHLCLPCEVSDSAAVAALFEQTCQSFSTVHILVNNAALVPGRPQNDSRRNKHYGYLTTPQPREALKRMEPQRNQLWQILPLGRLGTMQEYADTALFLAGSHYLVGQVISPNGGAVI